MFKKSKSQIISDAVCGILMILAILVFILVGVFAHVWHPTWIVIPCTALVTGIIEIIVNTASNLNKQKNEETTSNKSDK